MKSALGERLGQNPGPAALSRARRLFAFYRGVVDSGHIGDRIGSDYADHLTEADLRVLASASDAPTTPEQLRRSPDTVPALLDRPAVYEAVLGVGVREPGLVVGVSPFLVFAVAVHRLAADLSRRSGQEHRADGARHEGPSASEQLRDFRFPRRALR